MTADGGGPASTWPAAGHWDDGSRGRARLGHAGRHAAGAGAPISGGAAGIAVAVQHINFYGRYEFTKAPALINVDGIIAELAQRPIVPSEDDA